jgi:hypothetical protein
MCDGLELLLSRVSNSTSLFFQAHIVIRIRGTWIRFSCVVVCARTSEGFNNLSFVYATNLTTSSGSIDKCRGCSRSKGSWGFGTRSRTIGLWPVSTVERDRCWRNWADILDDYFSWWMIRKVEKSYRSIQEVGDYVQIRLDPHRFIYPRSISESGSLQFIPP